MKPNEIPERDVVKRVRDVLKLAKVFNVRMVGGPYIPKGIPDLLCCQKVKVKDLARAGIDEIGVFVGIEVKGSRGKESEEQIRFGEALRSHGGIYMVARDEKEVIDGLGLFGRLMPLFDKKGAFNV